MTDDLNKTTNIPGPGDDWNPDELPEKYASDGDLPLVLNAYEVADLLRVSYRVIITMAKAGDIPAFVIAGQWRFSRNAVLKWIEDQSNQNYSGYPPV